MAQCSVLSVIVFISAAAHKKAALNLVLGAAFLVLFNTLFNQDAPLVLGAIFLPYAFALIDRAAPVLGAE